MTWKFQVVLCSRTVRTAPLAQLPRQGKFVDGKRTGTGRVFDFKPDGVWGPSASKRAEALGSRGKERLKVRFSSQNPGWVCFI